MTKTEGGVEFPAAAYAYVGDPEKAETWKLRIWEDLEKKITVEQLGRAAAALSPGGFRGQKVDLPAEAVAGVKARIRAEYKKLDAEAPASVAASEGPWLILALAEAPEKGWARTPLAKLGKWWKGKLHFAITRADLAAVVANFRKRVADLVFDYDHATIYAAGSGQPVPAAGWIKDIEPEPDSHGILWGLVEWTDKARAMIAAKEYKYASPVIDWTVRDKKTGELQGATITSMALTGSPVLEELAVALSETAGWVEEISAERREQMAVKKLILADRAAGTARAVLEDGTETVFVVEGLAAEVKPVVLSEIKRAADGRFDFAALSEGDRPIGPEVFRAMTVQSELDAAVKETKILPVQRPQYEKLALSDLAAFRELVKTLKPQIDLTERGIAGGTEGGDLAKVDGQIDRLAREKMAADKIGYGQAFKAVLSEKPDLAKRRIELMR